MSFVRFSAIPGDFPFYDLGQPVQSASSAREPSLITSTMNAHSTTQRLNAADALRPREASLPSRRPTGFGRLLRTLAEHWIWLGPVMIVVVGIFDLACTIMAFENGWLVEMNPIANAALEWAGSPGLALYRFVMTAGGCLLLVWGLRMYRLRRFVGFSAARVRAVVWGGQGVLVATHVALVFYWVAWLNV